MRVNTNRHQSFTRSIRAGLLGAALAAALQASALAACLAPMRFGLADPLTGPSAVFGIDQIQAVKWAVEDVNKAAGPGGCTLEVFIQDHQTKPETGIAVVNRFIGVDKLPVFATAFSNVVKAVAPIANREKVLMLSNGANSPDIKDLGRYVYTTFPLADVDMRALGNFMVRREGKKRAAVLFVNHETGVDGAKVFRDSFEKAGGQVVLFDAYEETQTDFTGLVLKVRAANPDMVHIHGVVSDFTAIVAQMRQLGLNMQITSYQTAFNPKMIQELGSGADGIILTSVAPTEADNPNLGPFLARWRKEFGREPNGLPYVQYFYDVPYLVAQLYRWVDEQNLPRTGDNMRKALLTVRTFDLPLTGRVTFNDDHTVDKPTYFWQVRDGKFQPIGKTD